MKYWRTQESDIEPKAVMTNVPWPRLSPRSDLASHVHVQVINEFSLVAQVKRELRKVDSFDLLYLGSTDRALRGRLHLRLGAPKAEARMTAGQQRAVDRLVHANRAALDLLVLRSLLLVDKLQLLHLLEKRAKVVVVRPSLHEFVDGLEDKRLGVAHVLHLLHDLDLPSHFFLPLYSLRIQRFLKMFCNKH
jgi:hypothetical protein